VTWLVVAEAVVICVLGLVVVALAHSYAGLAARAEQRRRPGAAAHRGDELDPGLELVEPLGTSTTLRDLDGVTPAGESVLVPLAGAVRDTLLAFLSSSCATCRELWDELSDATARDVFDHVRLIVVTKGPEHESPSAMAELAAGAGDTDVVMSSATWRDVAVPGSPYFALVSRRTGELLGQGTARTWEQVAGLIALSAGDERLGRRTRKSRRDRRQEVDVDRLLLEAGVLPGDPSLYPVRPEGTPAP
jgi:hypothetical protein